MYNITMHLDCNCLQLQSTSIHAKLKDFKLEEQSMGGSNMTNYVIEESTREEYALVDQGIVEYNLSKVRLRKNHLLFQLIG
jgi:hypothetical protein